MKSMQLRDGDVVLSANRRANFVYGKDKLLQDLQLWLLEPVGTGYVTKRFGSLLDSLIGSNSPQQQVAQIVTEVQRVLALYQRWQIERMRQSKEMVGDMRYWHSTEVLNLVEDIETDVFGNRVQLRVKIRTFSNDSLTLPLVLDGSGLQVRGA